MVLERGTVLSSVIHGREMRRTLLFEYHTETKKEEEERSNGERAQLREQKTRVEKRKMARKKGTEKPG